MAKKTSKTKKNTKTKQQILLEQKEEETKLWISGLILLAITIVAYFKFGSLGQFLNNVCRFFFGNLYGLMLMLFVIQVIFYLINNKNGLTKSHNPTVLILLVVVGCMFSTYRVVSHDVKGFAILSEFASHTGDIFLSDPEFNVGGGIIGALVLSLSTMLVDFAGSILVMIVMLVIAIMLIRKLDVYRHAMEMIADYFSLEGEYEEDEDYVESYVEEPVVKAVKSKLQRIDLSPKKEEVVEVVESQPTIMQTQNIPVQEEVVEPKVEQPSFGIKVDRNEAFDPIMSPLEKEEVVSHGIDIITDHKKDIKRVRVEPVKETSSIFMNISDLQDPRLQEEKKSYRQEPYISTVSPHGKPMMNGLNQPVIRPMHGVEDVVEEVVNEVEIPQVAPVAASFLETMPVLDDVVVEKTVQRSKYHTVEETVVPIKEEAHFVQNNVQLDQSSKTNQALLDGLADEQVVSDVYLKQEVKQPVVEPVRNEKPYVLPGMDLLDPIPPKKDKDLNAEAAKEKGQLLINVLNNFGIEARLLDVHIGPSVTKFEIRPEAGVKVSKILNLTDDIKMQMAVRDIRIEAPIPGLNAVGVEIPNVESVPVKMRQLVGQINEKDKDQPLVIMLGKDLMGRTITCRLDKMPHLLIAGATGAGKSVCMNSIITSLLMRTNPEDVKLLLVDPKKVEFTPYQKVPHLIGPVINDPNQANNALKVIVKIMDERYDMFAKASVRNIQGYNKKVKQDQSGNAPKPMPFIVVIIDELADLMAVAGKDVEQSIQRITQLARAAGIHLIVATQRPSTDVITGIIKANIPSRIAFSVSSGIDSRTILDHTGAERLLGNGDMLYLPIGAPGAIRVQGVFVTDDEVMRITDFVSVQRTPRYDDSFVRLEGIEGNEDTAVMSVDLDPLFDEVKYYIADVQKASTSLLQRRFAIGYNRAARIIDMLEEQGCIGPANGSKPREVYVDKEDLLQDVDEEDSYY